MRTTIVAALLITTAAVTRADCTFDPARVVAGNGWNVVSRQVTWVDASHKAVHFDQRHEAGAAYLRGCRFETGTIEFDVRGRDVLQRSFVGVAFHATDDGSYEAVYFRPFNFASPDPERHGHGVQYIFEPDFGWKRLRTDHPGVYEHAIVPPVAGDAWFHARVVVGRERVMAYVNGASTPALDVKRLTSRTNGTVGLWVGSDSDGDFANLRITPDH